jgi:hypothetical protein
MASGAEIQSMNTSWQSLHNKRRGQESSPKAQLLLDRRVCWKNLHHLAHGSFPLTQQQSCTFCTFPPISV